MVAGNANTAVLCFVESFVSFCIAGNCRSFVFYTVVTISMVAGHAFTTVFSFVKLFVVCFFANNFYVAFFIPIYCCAVNHLVVRIIFRKVKVEAHADIFCSFDITEKISCILIASDFRNHRKFECFAFCELFVLVMANFHFAVESLTAVSSSAEVDALLNESAFF